MRDIVKVWTALVLAYFSILVLDYSWEIACLVLRSLLKGWLLSDADPS